MNIKQLKRFLPYAFKVKASVMVHGLHGIGKSQAIKQFAEENDLEFIDRRLSQMESGDLLGLPDLSNGTTRFVVPSWLPRDPESKGVLFLDEINRARRDVLQGVFQLVLDRQLGDYTLPAGWHVISAVNPNTDDYDVTNIFDAALMDRFLHVKLTPTKEEYINFMRSQPKYDSSFIDFLQAREELIEDSKLGTFSLERKPSRRSNAKAAELLSVGLPDDLATEGLGGLIGIANAVAYKTWLEENNVKPFTADEVFGSLSKIEDRVKTYTNPISGRSDVITASLDNVMALIEEKNGKFTDTEIDNLSIFLQKIPKDLAIAFYIRISKSGVVGISNNMVGRMLESDHSDWLLPDPKEEKVEG